MRAYLRGSGKIPAVFLPIQPSACSVSCRAIWWLNADFLAAFGIPSESPDASLLQAWLTRNVSLPLGLVLRVPSCPPPNVAAHLCHLMQRLLKARHKQETPSMISFNSAGHGGSLSCLVAT